MPLSDTAIKAAKPRRKPYKIYDSAGLFLMVTPTGNKWWRMKHRFGGKEKLLAIGVYPHITLKDVRIRRDQELKHLAFDVDPAINRKAQKLAQADGQRNTFEVIAREWVEKRAHIWASSHSQKIIRRLELDVFPWIGKRPVNEIKPFELLDIIRRIEKRGAIDTAHRALQNCGQILRYAVATGRAERDSCADLRGALSPVKEGHFAAVTDPKAIGDLLRAMDAYHGNLVTRCAMRLMHWSLFAPASYARPSGRK